MSDDTTEEGVIQTAAGELDTAQNQTAAESYRASIEGWRRIAGTSVGFAVFLDLAFLTAGWLLYADTTGWTSITGILVIAVGLLGLAEKTLRRAV